MPQVDASLVAAGVYQSPLHGLQPHHSKERILNTTFQQKKFQAFERKAKQQEQLNYQIIEQNRGATASKKMLPSHHGNRNDESTPEILRTQTRSAFHNMQTQPNEETNKRVSRKALVAPQKTLN